MTDDQKWLRRWASIRRSVGLKPVRRTIAEFRSNEALFCTWNEAGRPAPFLDWAHTRRR